MLRPKDSTGGHHASNVHIEEQFEDHGECKHCRRHHRHGHACKHKKRDPPSMKWLFLFLLVAGTIFISTSFYLSRYLFSKEKPTTARERLAYIKELFKRVPLIDGHNDLPFLMRTQHGLQVSSCDLTKDMRTQLTHPDMSDSHTDIPRLREGLLGAQFWSVFVPCKFQYVDAVPRTLEQLDILKQVIRKYSDHLEEVTTADGIMEAFNRGKIASLIGLEGGHMIAESVGILRMFYELGVRYMTLTWNCNTIWADCNRPNSDEITPKNNGLSKWGKKLIGEMNRLGMMVDISHVSPKTMDDVLDVTLSPIIFSHSSAYALCPHPRNVPDHILKRVAENGGVVMVTFVPFFINCTEETAVLRHRQMPSSLKQVADHIEHIRNVAGIDSVGIGGDYDGMPNAPDGLEDVSKYPYLFSELLRRGWEEEDLIKLAGQNVIRVMKENERIRDKMAGLPPMDLPADESAIPDQTCRSYDWNIW